MPKILFLTIHRPDRNPSQRFRFEQYLRFLNQNGYDYEFSYLLGPKADKIFYSKGRFFSKFFLLIKAFIERLIDLYSAKDFDIIFIHRECFFLGTSFFEKRFAKSGAKLVFDFDDSIWLQNVSEANRYYKFLKNPSKTMELIKLSHLVIAGNNYLAEYAGQFHNNVMVIPTTIDTNYHRPSINKNQEDVVIGWTGTHSTIKYLFMALPILKKIQETYSNVTFRVICENQFSIYELGIQTTAWSKNKEIEQLQEFDIGVMPLPNDEWVKGKCGFKGLQYMGLSIPTVMSPVGVNNEIIQDGINGFLADAEQEWLEKLSQLIESKELREKLGIAGRKTVEEKYSVEANKRKYLEAFNSLLKR